MNLELTEDRETPPWLGCRVDGDRFLEAARRLAAKDRDGLADPEDVAIELGIGLYDVTELVPRYQESFDWPSVPLGNLKLRS